MDFNQKVAAFTRKKKGQSAADEKREAYRAMLKEYQSMKYAPASGGQRREREITQELVERRAEAKREVALDTVADSLINLVDLDIGAIAPTGDIDLDMGGAKPASRKGKGK